jgi:hypothetical protein
VDKKVRHLKSLAAKPVTGRNQWPNECIKGYLIFLSVQRHFFHDGWILGMIWASFIVESGGGYHSPFLFIEGVCLLSLAHTQTQRPTAPARMHHSA